jgi:ring-1,2-phenylacetyl-CoA epoxidase subunit PaaD
VNALALFDQAAVVAEPAAAVAAAAAADARGAVAPGAAARIASAWAALRNVEDPEIPAVSVVDLGVIRFVTAQSDGSLEVGVSPTYTGCPATEVIQAMVERALGGAGADVGVFRVVRVLAPAWSSDWITAEGRRKLTEYGIVPPDHSSSSLRDLRHGCRPVACPRCHSTHTETVSEFGSTPCKALLRCRECLEPFEYFKCI